MSTPTNNDGWTSEPPNVAGDYRWKQHEGSIDTLLLHVSKSRKVWGHGMCGLADVEALSGLWRRLVPAGEVERAYKEGANAVCKILNAGVYVGANWNQSRAKKVMEGTEQ